MSDAERRLSELGLTLPQPPPPIANYVGAVTAGNLVFVSGHGPWRDGSFQYLGKLGEELDLDDGREAAKLVMLNCLASLKSEIGDLDRVHRIVKVLGLVNSEAHFSRQPEVIDAASDLLTAIFGDRGLHSRSAIGVAALPRGISVEIEMVVELTAPLG